MADYLARVDLVICRAGATTCAELVASRKPALLVPFAAAADNHQEFNARELEKAGGAEVILEKDFQPGLLAEKIKYYLNHKEVLDRMEKNLEKCDRKEWPKNCRSVSGTESGQAQEEILVKKGYRKLNRIHMVGIGGTGMCGIAEVLLNLGYEVPARTFRKTKPLRGWPDSGPESTAVTPPRTSARLTWWLFLLPSERTMLRYSRPGLARFRLFPELKCWPS